MTEPIKVESALAPKDSWISRAASIETGANLNPSTLEGVTQLAQMMQKSPLLPKALQGDLGGTILILAQTIQLGIPWTVGLKELYIVGNKVSVQARLLRALVERDPNCLQFYVKEATETRSVVVVQRRGMKEPLEVVYTLEDARKAGLIEKNPNYKSRPREMLIARASSLAANTYFPSVCLGLDLDDPEVAYTVASAPEPPPLRRRRQAKPDPLADFEPEVPAKVPEAPIDVEEVEQEDGEEPYPRYETVEPEAEPEPEPEPIPAPKRRAPKVKEEAPERPGNLLIDVRPPTPPVAQVDEEDAQWVVEYAKRSLGDDDAKASLRRLLADAGVSGYASVKEGVMSLTTEGYARVLMALRAQVKDREAQEEQPTRGRRV